MTPVSCNMTSGEMTFGMTDGMPLVMISDKLSVVYHKNQVRSTKKQITHRDNTHSHPDYEYDQVRFVLSKVPF